MDEPKLTPVKEFKSTRKVESNISVQGINRGAYIERIEEPDGKRYIRTNFFDSDSWGDEAMTARLIMSLQEAHRWQLAAPREPRKLPLARKPRGPRKCK